MEMRGNSAIRRCCYQDPRCWHARCDQTGFRSCARSFAPQNKDVNRKSHDKRFLGLDCLSFQGNQINSGCVQFFMRLLRLVCSTLFASSLILAQDSTSLGSNETLLAQINTSQSTQAASSLGSVSGQVVQDPSGAP